MHHTIIENSVEPSGQKQSQKRIPLLVGLVMAMAAAWLGVSTLITDVPEPTLANVAYGEHPKQVLHFWQAESDEPTPLVFFIHGGGWQGQDRLDGISPFLTQYLENEVSVVSIEYRFISEATADGEEPPVRGPMRDAARALQFVRSKAEQWNIDETRIAASGGSAGGCTSLWLAFHDDMADHESDDPIARESTRVMCAAVTGTQTTLDPQQMKEWIPNSNYGGHAFGFKPNSKKNISRFDAFLAGRKKILPWIAEYSPYALCTEDDPPVYLSYRYQPALGKKQENPTHSANFGVKLQEKCRELGVECELVYPGAPNVKHESAVEYLLEKLKA